VPDFTVDKYGIDSSGRAILMTAYMAAWWEGVVDALGFRPVITQGAWMARVPGGGAENSEGFHDGGGCLDLRVWDRTPLERLAMVKAIRLHGAGGWRRYKVQGMTEDHLHLVLGTDHGLTDGAAAQWRDYIDGRDGLADNGPDYEWRPSPLVLTPPEDIVTPEDIEAIAKRTAELVWAQAIGKDKTPAAKVLGALKTWLARQS
jgi:hypothetical protein